MMSYVISTLVVTILVLAVFYQLRKSTGATTLTRELRIKLQKVKVRLAEIVEEIETQTDSWEPPRTVKFITSWWVAGFKGWIFFFIGTTVYLFGLAVCSGAGYLMGTLVGLGLGMSVCGGTLWSVMYISFGFRSLGYLEFAVVERTGTFYRVMLGGWHVLCLPGIIDKVVSPQPPKSTESTFEIQSLVLYKDEEIDLVGGTSVKIAAHAYYQIPKRADMVLRWQYVINDVKTKLKDLFENATRGILQSWTLNEALQNRGTLWQTARQIYVENGKAELLQESIRGLEDLGVIIDDDNPLIVSDIILDEKIKTQRIKVLEAEQEAEAIRRKGRGRVDEIIAFKKRAGGIGDKDPDPTVTISDSEIVAYLLNRSSLEAVQNSKASLTLVAQAMNQVATMFNAGG